MSKLQRRLEDLKAQVECLERVCEHMDDYNQHTFLFEVCKRADSVSQAIHWVIYEASNVKLEKQPGSNQRKEQMSSIEDQPETQEE